MDEPSTSIHSGDVRADPRSSRATVSGFVATIAGVSLVVRSTDPTRVAALRGSFDPQDGPDPQGGAGAELGLELSGEAPDAPDGEPVEAYPDLLVWRDGEVLIVEHESGVRARAEGSRAVIGGDAQGVDLAVAYRRITPHALAHLLAGHDRFLLHAAAVAPPGSAAIMLVGTSGAGKSTLTYGALRAGWDVYGDDLVVVARAPTGIVVAGVAKPLAVPAQLIPDAGATELVPGDWRDRVGVTASVLAAGDATVAGVALLERGADREITAVDPAIAVRVLIGSFPAASEPGRARRFLPVAAQLARGSTCTFAAPARAETDPAAALAALTRVLESF